MMTTEQFWQQPFFLIAGPCVLSDPKSDRETGRVLKEVCGELGIPYCYKASFDKANRTSLDSFRGPGLEKGLAELAEIREQVGVPVLTDIHSAEMIPAVARVVDVIQIPAFLCRQTDIIVAAAQSGRPVNIKKGQFMAPWEMENVVHKARAAGATEVILTDRGTMFGYNNLVTDLRAIPIMQQTGCPVVFDATHSVQLPGGQGGASGGQREFAPVLARAAVAAGCQGLFVEVYPDPDNAPCDGPNALALDQMHGLLQELKAIHQVVSANRQQPPAQEV